MSKDIRKIAPFNPVQVNPGKQGPLPGREKHQVFDDLLQRELGRTHELKFSAHAEKRLQERNISLAPEDLAKINRAVRQAEAKGARESLILIGDLALVTSIKNKTVVTAMDGKSAQEHVFTNIDSAVIVK